MLNGRNKKVGIRTYAKDGLVVVPEGLELEIRHCQISHSAVHTVHVQVQLLLLETSVGIAHADLVLRYHVFQCHVLICEKVKI